MVDGLGVHAADEGDVIDDFGGVGEKLGELGAAFAVRLEFERRADDQELGLAGGHAGDALIAADGFGEFLAGEIF